jgi:hypothetical protein
VGPDCFLTLLYLLASTEPPQSSGSTPPAIVQRKLRTPGIANQGRFPAKEIGLIAHFPCRTVAARGILLSQLVTGGCAFAATILWLFCTPPLDVWFDLYAPQPFVQVSNIVFRTLHT